MVPHVLIVDDEPLVLESTAELLGRLFEGRAGLLTARSMDEAIEVIEKHSDTLAVAVVDHNLGESKKTGEQLLKAIRRLSDDVFTILNTAYGTKEMFKRGVNEGWLDAIVEKDGSVDVPVAQGLEAYEKRYGKRDAYIKGLIGSSATFKRCLKQVIEMRRPSPGKGYLLVGERGSGKQVVAEVIHLHFGRTGEFHTENCASFDHNAEMQLFGVREKAFPGVPALQGAVGAAQGGTLFLDEFHALEQRTQRKLNRLIEYGDYSLYGDSATKLEADCLIIAATNRSMHDVMRGGWFNEDLRDRFLIIEVPPLHDRMEDIPDLVRHYITKHLPGRHWEGARPEATPEALAALARHSWPGNIRMLENVVIEALAGYTGLKPEVFSTRLVEAAEHQHARVSGAESAAPAAPSAPVPIPPLRPGASVRELIERCAEIIEAAMSLQPRESWTNMEKRLINGALLALCERHGSQIEVANRLGIPRATLNARVKQAQLLGLEALGLGELRDAPAPNNEQEEDRDPSA
ncbi:MAG: sigma 54-interacting transcriptional regulator [Planctomycetota bacterium]